MYGSSYFLKCFSPLQVLCANPVIPADWSIAYPAFLNDSDPFSFTLTIAGDKELPTRPTLRIVEVQGMQRLDNDIDILNETAITFFFNENANAAVTDCSKDKDGAGCYDILEARYKSTTIVCHDMN